MKRRGESPAERSDRGHCEVKAQLTGALTRVRALRGRLAMLLDDLAVLKAELKRTLNG